MREKKGGDTSMENAVILIGFKINFGSSKLGCLFLVTEQLQAAHDEPSAPPGLK